MMPSQAGPQNLQRENPDRTKCPKGNPKTPGPATLLWGRGGVLMISQLLGSSPVSRPPRTKACEVIQAGHAPDNPLMGI